MNHINDQVTEGMYDQDQDDQETTKKTGQDNQESDDMN